MQWLLQPFEDTHKLADALERLEIAYSWHKVVPFVGDLIPEPDIIDRGSVILFGSYTLWRYAEAHALKPGVFKIAPFLYEAAWHEHLLNGTNARVLTLRDVPDQLADDGQAWFLRPVDDSKAEPGSVKSASDIIKLATTVLTLDENDIPRGSLRHDTQLMLCQPAHILKEWRLWIVNGEIVTHSLYKEGARVVYRPDIDDDALQFAQHMVDLNPSYSPAYVMDICRTQDGLRLLETNCLNAAGFYAADLLKLAIAIHTMRMS